MPPKNNEVVVKIESALCKRVDDMCNRIEGFFTPNPVKGEVVMLFNQLKDARLRLKSATDDIERIEEALGNLVGRDSWM